MSEGEVILLFEISGQKSDKFFEELRKTGCSAIRCEQSKKGRAKKCRCWISLIENQIKINGVVLPKGVHIRICIKSSRDEQHQDSERESYREDFIAFLNSPC